MVFEEEQPVIEETNDINTAAEPTFNIEHYQTVIDISSESDVEQPPTKRARGEGDTDPPPTRPTLGMQILVKTLTGKTITIDDVFEHSAIDEISLAVDLKTGVPMTYFYLSFRGRRLIDKATVSSYGITKGDTLYMCGRLRGGMNHNFDNSQASHKIDGEADDPADVPVPSTQQTSMSETVINGMASMSMAAAEPAQEQSFSSADPPSAAPAPPVLPPSDPIIIDHHYSRENTLLHTRSGHLYTLPKFIHKTNL